MNLGAGSLAQSVECRSQVHYFRCKMAGATCTSDLPVSKGLQLAKCMSGSGRYGLTGGIVKSETTGRL